jgi:hypothetical protein
MNRTYKEIRPRAGLKGTIIAEFVDGRENAAVLHLPDGTPPEALADVTTALQQALRTGFEDRSEEILGDEGLARAAAEVGRHEPYLHMSGLSCEGEGCDYHDPEGDDGKWALHVAYAVLQAAARTT